MAYQITQACIGCTLCAKNCPVHAIAGHLKERHTVNVKRCVECGVCSNVCPKGAITDKRGKTVEKIPRERWKKPLVNTELCSACTMCVDICGFSCLAITYPESKGDLKVFAELKNAGKCVGCGLCEQVCPLHAITMKGGVSDETAGLLPH